LPKYFDLPDSTTFNYDIFDKKEHKVKLFKHLTKICQFKCLSNVVNNFSWNLCDL